MQADIIVHNSQGASEVYKGTVEECKQWLTDTWSDPENLSAKIHIEGRVVATKARGQSEWE